MAIEEGSAHPQPRHLPTPGGLSKGIGELARSARRHWGRITLSLLGIGTLTGGVWEWNQSQQQKPVTPKEDKISTPPAFAPGAGNERVVPIETVTPTATKQLTETPANTPTATATRTATPTPAFTERKFTTGVVERLDMVTEANFAQYFEWVSQEDFQQLSGEQTNLPGFPFTVLGEKFSIGETISPSGYYVLRFYSPHILIVTSDEGYIDLLKSGSNYSGFNIVKTVSDTERIMYQVVASGKDPKFQPKIEAPIWTGNDTKGTPIKKGVAVAEFNGSGKVDNTGKYSAPENQLSLIIYGLKTLPKPEKIPGTTLTRTAEITYTTPSLTEPQNWVHTKAGKIAMMRY